MGLYDRVINWCLLHKNTFQLNIIQNHWPKIFGIDSFDFTVEMSILDKKVWGRGLRGDEKEALFVAIMECLERTVMYYNKVPNSNGMAAHSDFEKAKLNAKLELLERDAFLCHYFTETPYFKISERELPYDKKYSNFKKILNRLGLFVEHYRMRSLDKNTFLALTFVFGERTSSKFGFCMGASAKETEVEAISRSMEEAALMGLKQLIAPTSELTSKNFFNLEKTSFYDHHCLSLNIEYAHKFRGKFLKEDVHKEQVVESDSIIQSIQNNSLRQPEIIKELGLHFFRATSTQLQSLFTGRTTYEKVNFGRLRAFDRNFKKENLYFEPHPFP